MMLKNGQENNIMTKNRFDTFENYLIMVGIRSLEYNFTDDELFEGTELFKKCYENHIGAYYALLYLNDYLKDPNSVIFEKRVI